MYNNAYLQHWGILGMKWGQRRYQKEDGSLTSAGKKRYQDSDGNLTAEGKEKLRKTVSVKDLSDSDLQSHVKRMALEKQYTNFSKENQPESKLSTAKKSIDAVSSLVDKVNRENKDAIKNRPKEKLDLSELTDQDLRDKIGRANLERQYSDIFANQIPIDKGRDRMNTILETAGGVLAVAGSAITIMAAIKELKK